MPAQIVSPRMIAQVSPIEEAKLQEIFHAQEGEDQQLLFRYKRRTL